MTDLTKLGVALTVGSAVGAGVAALFLNPAKKQAALASNDTTMPKLYIYEHCPFCVRARMILGLKKIPHELVFLANHDEATPIGLVGSKQVPILQLADGTAMPESMDIVRHLDANFGGSELLQPSADREDLKQWIKDTADVFRCLYHPRFHAAVFPEFAQHASREYYRIKKEKSIGPFDQALRDSPVLVEKANKFLEQLAPILHSNRAVNEALSYDDIDLFGRLRGLTMVKGLKWPPKVREYMEFMAKETDIALLDSMAQY